MSSHIFTSCLQILIVMFILNIWFANNNVTANENFDGNGFDYTKDSPLEDVVMMRRGVWSRLFRGGINTPQKLDGQSYPISMTPDLASINGRIQILPYDKRTIPIELRKALYAHGIVGRRR